MSEIQAFWLHRFTWRIRYLREALAEIEAGESVEPPFEIARDALARDVGLADRWERRRIAQEDRKERGRSWWQHDRLHLEMRLEGSLDPIRLDFGWSTGTIPRGQGVGLTSLHSGGCLSEAQVRELREFLEACEREIERMKAQGSDSGGSLASESP